MTQRDEPYRRGETALLLVDMAVRDGADLGYMITCVGDACAARTAQRHETALKAFGGYCWISDTATVAALRP